MTAYTFCIDSLVRGYCEYQSIWDIPLADGDLPCEQKMGNSHDLQPMVLKKVINGIPAGKLLGTCLRSIFHRICLIFITHARVYHWCVKIWMVKMLWIFGRSSISPNFSTVKVSLHTVYPNACINKLISTTPTRFNPYFGWYKSIWAIATHQPK